MKKMVQGMDRWEVQDAHSAQPEVVKTRVQRAVTRLGGPIHCAIQFSATYRPG